MSKKVFEPRALDDPQNFLLVWAGVTLGALWLGSVLGVRLSSLVPRTSEALFYARWAILGATRGLVLGLAQGWLLRGRVPSWGGWVVASALGLLAIGLAQPLLLRVIPVSTALEVLALAGQGALLGLCQWLVLRQRFAKAHWWIIALALGGGLEYLLGRVAFALIGFEWVLTAVWMVVLAAVSGVMFLILVDQEDQAWEVLDAPEPVRAPRPELTERADLRRSPERRLAFPEEDEPPAAPGPGAPAETNAEARRAPVPPVSLRIRAGALPRRLDLFRQKARFRQGEAPTTLAAAFEIELPRRPRRARLRLSYSGMSIATQAHFQQHVHLNGTVLLEFEPRGRKLQDVTGYTCRIPEELVEKQNLLVFTCLSDGTPQDKNPFQLHGAALEFEW